MSPEEVRTLLSYAAGIDSWLRAASPDDAAYMLAGWSDLLSEVPAEFAHEVIRDHYRESTRTITTADITTAWRGHLAALRTAIADGRDPKSVPRPAGVRVLSPRADEASRRCRWPDLCVCTHTECRAGWMDEETTVVNALGKSYDAVQRCPNCHDAELMAEERGLTRKRRRKPAGVR